MTEESIDKKEGDLLKKNDDVSGGFPPHISPVDNTEAEVEDKPEAKNEESEKTVSEQHHRQLEEKTGAINSMRIKIGDVGREIITLEDRIESLKKAQRDMVKQMAEHQKDFKGFFETIREFYVTSDKEHIEEYDYFFKERRFRKVDPPSSGIKLVSKDD